MGIQKITHELVLAMQSLNRHYRCSIPVVTPKSRSVAALVLVLGVVRLVVEVQVGVVGGGEQ
jgi:hypothetical protein